MLDFPCPVILIVQKKYLLIQDKTTNKNQFHKNNIRPKEYIFNIYFPCYVQVTSSTLQS